MIKKVVGVDKDGVIGEKKIDEVRKMEEKRIINEMCDDSMEWMKGIGKL